MFFSSCGKDKNCKCEAKYTDYYGYTYEDDDNFDKYDMEDYRVDNCDDLAKELEDDDDHEWYGANVDCEPRK